MLFLIGLFLGTFVGIVIAGLCCVAREHTKVRSSPVCEEQGLEAIQLQTSSFLR